MMPNLWQTRQSFWLHSSFYVLEGYPKNLNFQSFYTTKASFDGEFQWELCPNFQKKCSWGRYNYVEFFQVTSIFLVAASAFAFRKSFLPLRGLAVAAFSETGAFDSRWYEVEQVVLIPNLSETLEDFWSHSSVFALEKYSKNLSFKSIFTTKKTLVVTFSETRETVSSHGIMMPKLLETLQCFWFHFPSFLL